MGAADNMYGGGGGDYDVSVPDEYCQDDELVGRNDIDNELQMISDMEDRYRMKPDSMMYK